MKRLTDVSPSKVSKDLRPGEPTIAHRALFLQSSDTTFEASGPGSGAEPRVTISVLCVRHNSVYFQLEGCDCFDSLRNAFTFQGGTPVVAHPPCASWSRLRRFSKPTPMSECLGPWCISQVRLNGGVLEHPAQSSLWPHMHLPMPGCRDAWGFTFCVDQHWFGHQSRKRTWLYIVGVSPKALPPVPLKLHGALPPVDEASHAIRDGTPRPFAEWLVQVARSVSLT